MDERLATALSVGFPERTVDSIDAAGPSWNDLNSTVRVTFAEGDVVYLKVATDGNPTRIARERAVVAYVGATGAVPVPEIVASDTAGDVPFLATAPVDGRAALDAWSAADDDGRLAFCRSLGAGYARVHGVGVGARGSSDEFERHGHVVGGDEAGLELDEKPWTDVLVDTVEHLRTLAPAAHHPDHFDRVVDAVTANHGLLDDAPARLLHGDPAKPNEFMTADGMGLIDWELAHVGDPTRELRRAQRQLADAFDSDSPDGERVEALYDGYRAVAGSLPDGHADRLPVYDAVVFLGTSTYVEKLAPYVDRDLETLVEWTEHEMSRRLASIE